VSLHLIGLLGLFLAFVLGTLRPVNLGAVSLALAFLIGSLAAGESVPEILSGFPVDLFVLLAGVTYLFGVAASNGTLDLVVEAGARRLSGRRALIPWGSSSWRRCRRWRALSAPPASRSWRRSLSAWRGSMASTGGWWG
jgi:hypothetical protein